MNVLISQTTREKAMLQLRNHDKMYPLIAQLQYKAMQQKSLQKDH